MAGQNTHTFSFESIPNVARPVIVSTKQDAAGDGEGNRSNTTKNVVVRERVQLPISPDIKEPTRGIIGTGGKGVTIREESLQKN